MGTLIYITNQENTKGLQNFITFFQEFKIQYKNEIIKWVDSNPHLIKYQKSIITTVKKEDINYRLKNE